MIRIAPPLLLLLASTLTNAAFAAQPNVLFLFADDQRPDAIAALGHPQIITPNLDRLVNSGFTFHNAYCLGSNSPAVCLPSRNMLMSGRAYFRWPGPQAPADEPNFPASLRDAGYYTYHHGKHGNVALAIQERFETNKYLENDEADRTCGEPGKKIADDAIALLKSRPDDRPFFMYLAFANPHDPRVAAERYMNQYRREDIALPANFRTLHPFHNGEQLVRDELLAGFPRTAAEVKRHLHDYYATITGLDENIGRILATLHETGLDKNTIVIFSADHGLAMGSHGLMGKQSLYEDSMGAPLVFAGPGIPHGESDALVYLLDIFPTACELTGTSVPPGLDGRSLAPVILGQKDRVRDTLFLSYRDVQRAVRDRQWKLIRYPQINRMQLFDLSIDPHELHDLSEESDKADRIKQLTAEMERWQKDLGDALPLVSAEPTSAEFTAPTAEETKAAQPKPRKKAAKS